MKVKKVKKVKKAHGCIDVLMKENGGWRMVKKEGNDPGKLQNYRTNSIHYRITVPYVTQLR